MHITDKGMVDHLLGIVKIVFSKKDLESVNGRLFKVQKFPGFRLPSGGLATLKTTADENGDLLKVLPAALLTPDMASSKIDVLVCITGESLPF